jgi:dCMP deaminase
MVESRRRCWDCFFLAQVQLIAEQSTCRTRHVGAVLGRGKRVLAAGFNGTLAGHPHCDAGGCDRCAGASSSGLGLERCVCCHAEQNAVAWCAGQGVAAAGATAYVTTTPCLDCFKLLAGAGIAEVVWAESYPASEPIVRHLAALSGIKVRTFACACPDLLLAA